MPVNQSFRGSDPSFNLPQITDHLQITFRHLELCRAENCFAKHFVISLGYIDQQIQTAQEFNFGMGSHLWVHLNEPSSQQQVIGATSSWETTIEQERGYFAGF
jgi:hypothetical protein